MKKTVLLTLACCVSLMGCATQSDDCVEGKIVDTSMNTLTIEVDSNPMSFSTMDTDKSKINGLVLGKTVKVCYSGKYKEGMKAIKLLPSEK